MFSITDPLPNPTVHIQLGINHQMLGAGYYKIGKSQVGISRHFPTSQEGVTCFAPHLLQLSILQYDVHFISKKVTDHVKGKREYRKLAGTHYCLS